MREELFQRVIMLAEEKGYQAKWWTRDFPIPSSAEAKPIVRLYIKNSINIDGTPTEFSSYYIFENNEFLLNPSVRIGTKDKVDLELFQTVRKEVTSWLNPLTVAIKELTDSETERANKQTQVLTINIESKQERKVQEDDIPF